MAKRKSPDPDDIDRINETLNQRAGNQIQDRDSYDLAFDDYMGIMRAAPKQRKLRNDAFADYSQKHPDVSTERLFTKAKGKDLSRDRLRTAKRVVKTRKGFIKAGAANVDLKGFDTARQKVTKAQRIQRDFTIPARIKGRVVFARKTSVVVKGRSVVRHRDSKGRFVSVKVK